MKKNLKWRLADRPTPKDITELFTMGLVTKDEAREMLFSTETDRDRKDLESELKFLRELTEKLAKSPAQIVETIRYIEKPYQQYGWVKPYQVWCSSNGSLYAGISNSTTNATYGVNSLGQFSSIKTS